MSIEAWIKDVLLLVSHTDREIYDSLCGIMFHPSIQKAETDWYFMYCCCLLPHTVAWGCIIYPVPCLMCRAPFRQNSKSLHYTMGLRTDVVSLSLSRDHYTLSMVLTDRKHKNQLSIYSPLCPRLCFGLIHSPHRPYYSGYSGPKWNSDDSATMDGYFQRDIENYAGKLQRGTLSEILLDGSQPSKSASPLSCKHMTLLSLNSNPNLWLPGAFWLGICVCNYYYVCFAPGWTWHQTRKLN